MVRLDHGDEMIEALNLAELEELARAKLPQQAWDYYSSGADDEACLRRNCAAFSEIALHYRVLVDVALRRLETISADHTNCSLP